jgi:hypothetical protein
MQNVGFAQKPYRTNDWKKSWKIINEVGILSEKIETSRLIGRETERQTGRRKDKQRFTGTAELYKVKSNLHRWQDLERKAKRFTTVN